MYFKPKESCHMKLRISIGYFFMLMFISLHLHATDMLDYKTLSGLSATELIKYGDRYYQCNHLDTAIGYYIVLAGKYNNNMNPPDTYLCALACRSIANIYYQRENYSQAFEYYMKALRISEENDFGKLAADIYKNIGNIYAVFYDKQQGIECYVKGLELAERYRDTIVKMKILINLPGICSYDNRTEEAWNYYYQMLKFVGKDKTVEFFSYFNKALIYTAEKQYSRAVVCYGKAALYAEKEKLNPAYMGGVYGELAKLYRKIGQRDSALHYFRVYTDYSGKHKLMYMLVEGLQSLAQLHADAGNTRQSSYYALRYMAVNDSLFNKNEFNKMKYSQFAYEMDKNYQKIASLTKESQVKEQRIKTQLRILAGILAGMFTFAVLLAMVYAQKQKLNSAYKNLYHRNAEILLSEQKNRSLRIEYANKLVDEREKYALLEQKNALSEELKQQGIEAKEMEEEKATRIHSTDKLTDGQKEKILLAIIDVMENTQEFYDCNFSMERLAERIESNSRYVSVVINETYNKNFRTFVNEYRIKEAQLRLMNTNHYGNYTIKAIAESVGFKSSTNFISAFKDATGITPSIYQKIAKGR